MWLFLWVPERNQHRHKENMQAPYRKVSIHPAVWNPEAACCEVTVFNTTPPIWSNATYTKKIKVGQHRALWYKTLTKYCLKNGIKTNFQKDQPCSYNKKWYIVCIVSSTSTETPLASTFNLRSCISITNAVSALWFCLKPDWIFFHEYSFHVRFISDFAVRRLFKYFPQKKIRDWSIVAKL